LTEIEGTYDFLKYRKQHVNFAFHMEVPEVDMDEEGMVAPQFSSQWKLQLQHFITKIIGSGVCLFYQEF